MKWWTGSTWHSIHWRNCGITTFIKGEEFLGYLSSAEEGILILNYPRSLKVSHLAGLLIDQ